MTQHTATDTRPASFTIEEAVVDDYGLNPLAGWLYVVIVRHANGKTEGAFPSVVVLAALAHMSRASVLRYTTELEEKGLIKVDRDSVPGKKEKDVNHYRLLVATKPDHNTDEGSVSQIPHVVSDSNQVVSESDSIKIKDKNKDKDSAPQNGAASDALNLPTSSKKQPATAVAKTPQPPNSAPPPSPRNPIFDAVALYVFETSDPNAKGGRIAKISTWLEGKNEGKEKLGYISKPAEPDHVKSFAGWCKAKNISPPRDLTKFVEQWRAWAMEANRRTTRSTPLPVVAPIIRRTPAEMERLKLQQRAILDESRHQAKGQLQ